MRKSNNIRIVIADDHSLIRKGLVQIISENPDLELAGEVANGIELLEFIQKEPLDVVVMDIEMPEKSGWETMREIKLHFPKLPVIILSISPENEYAVKFFKAGAAGYIHKASAPEQLVGAIRKVAQGGKYVSPRLAEKLAFDLDEDLEKLPHHTLSPREFQVFCMIASGKTVKEISDELCLTIPTISTYRARILEKMDMKNNSQITNYAFKHKLIQ